MWHQSFSQLVYKKPEEYDLNHVTELRLNPGAVIHLIPNSDTTHTRGKPILVFDYIYILYIYKCRCFTTAPWLTGLGSMKMM